MLSWKKSLLLISLLLASSSAWSELVIRVTQGNDKPTTVAVSPIALNGLQYRRGYWEPLLRADLHAQRAVFRDCPKARYAGLSRHSFRRLFSRLAHARQLNIWSLASHE